jgi:RecJ-like exonuclease
MVNLYKKTMHQLTGRLDNIAYKGQHATEEEKPELRVKWLDTHREIQRRKSAGFAPCKPCNGTGYRAEYWRTDDGRCHRCAGTGFAKKINACDVCGALGSWESGLCATHEAEAIAANDANPELDFYLF